MTVERRPRERPHRIQHDLQQLRQVSQWQCFAAEQLCEVDRQRMWNDKCLVG